MAQEKLWLISAQVKKKRGSRQPTQQTITVAKETQPTTAEATALVAAKGYDLNSIVINSIVDSSRRHR